MLAVLHVVGILEALDSSINAALNPIQRWLVAQVQQTRLSEWGKRRSEARDLAGENEHLRDRERELLAENIELQLKLERSLAYEQQQAFMTERRLPSVPANVLGKSADQFSSTILIDRGSSDGLRVGLAVIAEKGFFLGKLSEVDARSSKIALATTGGQKVSAIVQSVSEVRGIVAGQLGLSLRLELVLQSELLRVGDLVITSGDEPDIPKHLIIGTIEDVDNPPGDLWQTAQVRSMIHADDLSIVSVLLPTIPEP